jgi:hypothetical protein
MLNVELSHGEIFIGELRSSYFQEISSNAHTQV